MQSKEISEQVCDDKLTHQASLFAYDPRGHSLALSRDGLFFSGDNCILLHISLLAYVESTVHTWATTIKEEAIDYGRAHQLCDHLVFPDSFDPLHEVTCFTIFHYYKQLSFRQ